MTRKIAIVLSTRGNYGKMMSVMRAILARSDLSLQIVLSGGILTDEFGDFTPVLAADGFRADRSVDFLVGGGGDLSAMTESAGRAVILFGEALAELAPDVVMVIADRYEALSLALAATCRAVPIAHLEGGERSGSIDDRLRHAVTKLAQIHFPASRSAADAIISMGEDQGRIHVVGSPSLDIIAALALDDLSEVDRYQARAGDGAIINHGLPFILVSQHPVVGEHEKAASQLMETAAAVRKTGLPAIWILPNMDAGNAAMRRAVARLKADTSKIRFYASMPLPIYARVMAAARCLVGNSSSGIREAAFLGTPTVNVGTRQSGRERGGNVVDAGYDYFAIAAAIAHQIEHGRYNMDPIYGDGHSGQKIATILAHADLSLNKPYGGGTPH